MHKMQYLLLIVFVLPVKTDMTFVKQIIILVRSQVYLQEIIVMKHLFMVPESILISQKHMGGTVLMSNRDKYRAGKLVSFVSSSGERHRVITNADKCR